MPGVPIIGPIMTKIFGTRNQRFVRRYLHRVEQISEQEPVVSKMTDEELRAKTAEFRARIKGDVTEQDLLVEAFAVAREVMDRAVGIRNIFNPEHKFDASRLPADVARAYEGIRALIASTPDAEPVGDLVGNVEPVPAWKTVPIPLSIYEAVRKL